MVQVLTLLLAALAALPQNPAEAADEAPRGVVLHEEGALEGYTLFSPLTGTGLLLIDMGGEVVHRWETATMMEAGQLLENGDVLCWGVASEEDHPRFRGPGVDGGLVQILAWDGTVKWRYVLEDEDQLLHHDVALLPNGNVLYLAWEHRYREDAIEWGRDPESIGEPGMWPDAIHEIRPTPPEGAEIVWEWHAWDHVVQDFDESRTNFGSVVQEPHRIDINADHRDRPPMTPEQLEELRRIEEEMAALGYGGDAEEDGDASADGKRTGSVPDWMHTNAIDYLPEHDLIVISTPTLGELWVLDHSTTTEEAAGDSGGRYGKGGGILWRWGNPRNHGAGDDADRKLFFQHDPTWLPPTEPGTLRLLVFNNGRGRPGGEHSSVDELVIPFDPAKGFALEQGKPCAPAGPAWSYSDPGTFYSSFISGAQRLPNGNTLICSGAQGRVFEVTRDGRVVWDYRNEHGGENDLGIPAQSVYRAYRIPKGHPGLAGTGL